MKSEKFIIPLLLGLFFTGTFAVLSSGNAETTAQNKSTPKKTGGMMGDPAGKRGVEYGFDKGFEAGKVDKDNELKPDPARHEDFNHPEKFFRHEFGSQGAFVQGFKSGFVGGYQKAFGKKVRISVPGVGSSSESPVTKSAPAGSDAL